LGGRRIIKKESLDDGDGHWPVLGTNVEGRGLVGLEDHAMHLLVAANKVCLPVLVGHIVPGVEYRARVGAEDCVQGRLVIGLGSVVKGQNSIARRSEGLLVRRLREGTWRAQQKRQTCDRQRERQELLPVRN